MNENLKYVKVFVYVILIVSILLITKDASATNVVILMAILSEICLNKK